MKEHDKEPYSQEAQYTKLIQSGKPTRIILKKTEKLTTPVSYTGLLERRWLSRKR